MHEILVQHLLHDQFGAIELGKKIQDLASRVLGEAVPYEVRELVGSGFPHFHVTIFIGYDGLPLEDDENPVAEKANQLSDEVVVLMQKLIKKPHKASLRVVLQPCTYTEIN